MMNREEEKPLVSIVILNYNGVCFLKNLFDSLRKCTYTNLEMIMVDNCSDDDSIRFAEENYPEVKILRNPVNYMYARGNNEGLKIARGEYICLLNNDTEVESGFIEPVIEAFERDKRIGAIQPKILAMQQRDAFEYAGACGGFIDALGYPFLRGRLLWAIEKDEGQYDDAMALFWASGACLFIRKETVADIGYLDEDFQLHQEEIDWCWRMKLADWKIFVIPQSRIWHHVGGTLEQGAPHKMYWNFRNNIFLLIKNFSFLNLAIRLPFRLPLDMLAFIRELLKKNWLHAKAIARAYGWILTHIPLMLRKRAMAQKFRKVPDKQVLKCMYPGSIIIEYFLLKCKKFSDLRRIKFFLARNMRIKSNSYGRK